MEKKSRIRFNPVTKEIEVEGTEKFVKTYFKKLQAMVFGLAEKTVAAKKAPKAAKAAPAKKTEKKEPKAVKARPPKKAKKATKKAPAEKKVTNIDTVVGFIQGSTEGISTVELKEKTGLVESQIWSIVNRAAKAGKIRKVKRGVYGAVAASQE
jgi:glucan-binding YG repeat protein